MLGSGGKMASAVFARQPIFDADLQTFGYELLYRRSGEDRANFVDGDHATASVVVGAIADLGLDQVCGTAPAFINVTRSLLLSSTVWTLPASRVVLEVLEDIEIDDALIEACSALSEAGYRIALDDLCERPGLDRLLPLAHFVKIDVMADGIAGVETWMKRLEPYDAVVVAEKIETLEEFEQCKKLGCSLFQGYFLETPQLLRRDAAAPSRALLLLLMARVYEPNVTLRELESIISSDVGLSYRILRIINSAYYHLPRHVSSVRQAVALLGLKFTRSWVTLIGLADLGDTPVEIVNSAVLRAKMCERLAELSGRVNSDAYYVCGLFSMLETILGRPLTEIIEDLPLTPTIKRALTSRDGSIGGALRCVEAHEQARWEEATYANLDPTVIQRAYLDAVAWTLRTQTALKAAS